VYAFACISRQNAPQGIKKQEIVSDFAPYAMTAHSPDSVKRGAVFVAETSDFSKKLEGGFGSAILIQRLYISGIAGSRFSII
jgi:hypothetical protein